MPRHTCGKCSAKGNESTFKVHRDGETYRALAKIVGLDALTSPPDVDTPEASSMSSDYTD